jgi:glucan 1,3-beta-glucosidase
VLNELLNYTATNGLIAHLDAGVYIVSDTMFIPPGARIVGEALAAIIMGTGAKFQDMSNPRPVVQIGMPGQEGRIEWSDTIVSTRGPCAGAIAIQYNLHADTGVPSGMWDVHIRIGGFAGTELQLNECAASSAPKGNQVDQNCIAAFMSMHITRDSGMLFTENCWVWVADHDLEDPWVRRVSIFAGRGVLIESERGQIWLSAASSEHHVLYQYQIQGSRAVYLGHAQTESPYYQPQPLARYPFPVVPELNDPDFERDCAADSAPGCESAWAIRVIDSSDIVVYGAGLYSFFDSYSDSCSRETSTTDCQGRLLSIQGNTPGVKFAGLSTVATRVMIHRDQKDFVHAQPNKGTFADTLALYLP